MAFAGTHASSLNRESLASIPNAAPRATKAVIADQREGALQLTGHQRESARLVASIPASTSQLATESAHRPRVTAPPDRGRNRSPPAGASRRHSAGG